MIRRLTFLLALFVCSASLVLAQSEAAAPAREYFRYTREVAISQPALQNYFVVDPALWEHAREDLADIRLFDGNTQVPYALSEEQGSVSTVEREARILNLGVRGGRTEFDIEIGSGVEYNHVELRLKAINFVATATAEGGDTLGGGHGRMLSTSTLYDLSRENLGRNFSLHIPLSTFRYLHVSIAPALKPADIAGASTSMQREAHASWIAAGHCGAAGQNGRITRISCDLDPGVPVERILFAIPPATVNFRRAVTMIDSKGAQLPCGGSISRIRMKSGGNEVATETLALSACTSKERQFVIEIDNGDNVPLPIDKVEPQSLERRIYFDPAAKTAITLYYGDEKLPAPEYDFAKFFHKAEDAAKAVLGPESQNASYTGRPDSRPWSERHGWVLWGAMLLAVAVLGGLALRGIAGGSPAGK